MKHPYGNRNLGIICFILAAVIYGSFGLLIRLLQKDFTAIQQVALRGSGAMVISGIWTALTLTRAEWGQLKQPRLWGFGLTFPISIIIWTTSVTVGTISSAIFGLYFGSLISSAIFGWKLYGEEITRNTLISIILALLAISIFAFPLSGLSSVIVSLVLSAVAGVLQTLNLCYRRWLGDISRPVVILVQSTGGFIISLIASICLSAEFPKISGPSLVIGFLFGALVVLVSYLLLVGSRHLEISKGSLILSTELIWATLFGVLLLGEFPSIPQVVGCIFLLAAIFVQNGLQVANNTALESSRP